MANSLNFVAIKPTPSLFSYVEDHAQNGLVLEMIRIFAKSPGTQAYVILPSSDSFPQEEITSLSVGWRTFPPNSVIRSNVRPLFLEMLHSFLSSNSESICLFPNEFSPNSEFQKSRNDEILRIDGYPYLYIDDTSNTARIIDTQNASRGYLYNGLLFEVAEKFDTWDIWFNGKKSPVDLAAFAKCVIVEAYDGDSFLLVVPDTGIATMKKRLVATG